VFEINIASKNGKYDESVRCGADSCLLGRSRDSIIRVRGWKVAPSHVRIEKTIGGLFIEDLSRGFGVQVNGKKISERHGPLEEEDVVEFGGYLVKIALVNDKPIADEIGLTEQSTNSDTPAPATDSIVTDIPPETDDQNGSAAGQHREAYMQWTKHVHSELLRQMDLRRMHIDELSPDEMRNQLSGIVSEIIATLANRLPAHVNAERLHKIVLDETVGLGALEELLDDKDITEIMVNNFDDIYIEKAGRLQNTEVVFSSPDAVMSTIERIISPLGRRIDESSPMVDARLADGSRVNAIIPPLALRGPCITIRKFSDRKLTDRDLLNFGTVNESMVTFMRMCVEQRCNVIVSGGTGSGKTTLLNILSNFIPIQERVITVEDAAELKLVQPHVLPLEARPPNMEGKGQVTIRELVKNCLRMRPDRIVVGECRGGEALDMLQAMNTGHDGSLTTAHANTPRDMLRRLEVMVLMAGMDLPISAIREQVASAVDIVIQQSRFGDGTRKITSICEITGIEGTTIQLSEIFKYQQEGFDDDGRVAGKFMATGTVPTFYEELKARGIPVDMSIFTP
jgi:pilus assembly protein CpaF